MYSIVQHLHIVYFLSIVDIIVGLVDSIVDVHFF